ncbi:DPB1 protein, partial [Pomatorhinus ruficollis]|nr:DPB1 protein [Pomatorhinus ruficollis]
PSASHFFNLVGALDFQPGPRGPERLRVDFLPGQIQLRWFQGQQELSGHVVATAMFLKGDWTHQLLVLLEMPPSLPWHKVTSSYQVEHVSLEQPLRQHW